MIADRPRPFIFVHVPKNAGTSIEKALLPVATGQKDFKFLSPHLRKRHLLPGGSDFSQHYKLRQIEKVAGDLDRYFKFAFVRNPFERALSQITYLRRFPLGQEMFAGRSWKDDLMTLAHVKQNIAGQDLGAMQKDYLTAADGTVSVDFIGRFEDLQGGWETVKTALDLPDSLELGWIFKSRNYEPAECYDEESRQAIAEKYQTDFETFAYDPVKIS